MNTNPDDYTKEELAAHLEKCFNSTRYGAVAFRSRSLKIRARGEFETYWALIDEINPVPYKHRGIR